MPLNPPSRELNRTGYGYWVSTGHGMTAKRQLISHLLYMDGLKLHGRNPDQLLDRLLHTVCDDIKIRLGLNKSAAFHQWQVQVSFTGKCIRDLQQLDQQSVQRPYQCFRQWTPYQGCSPV